MSGIRRIDHVAIAVRDADQATEQYVKLLGAVHFSSTFVDDEAAARRWISEIDRKRFPNSPSQPSVRPSASVTRTV